MVNVWAVQRAACGFKPGSKRTGAYCRARGRLPLAMIRGLACEMGRQLHRRARRERTWRGRSVKLVDGTGIAMPDTNENQARYSQQGTQADGVGFRLARVVVVVCLATGAVLDAAIGAHSGKGTGEFSL